MEHRQETKRRRRARRRSVRIFVVIGVVTGGMLSTWGRIQRHRGKPLTIPSSATHEVSPKKTSISRAVKITVSKSDIPSHALIEVPPQSQFPELRNGCEVTSLSMLMTAVGHPVDKMTLAKEQPKDTTKLVMDSDGQIKYWGNPNVGFVGSVYDYGYGIYHGPMVKFINELLPGSAKDLTGRPFSDILAEVAKGHPVLVWTTATFYPTTLWQTWGGPAGIVRATMEEHTVLLVGFDQNQFFVNDPLTGKRAEPVDPKPFLAAWKQLGEQAVTLIPPAKGVQAQS